MKDKILDIVAEHCVGWKNCEALTEKLFDLYNVVSTSNCDFCGSEIGTIRKVCHVCIDEMQDRD